MTVLICQIGSTGQAEPLVEEYLGHRSTPTPILGIDRLQVHGLPDRPGLDVVLLEVERMSSREAPNASGSTRMQVSQQLDRP